MWKPVFDGYPLMLVGYMRVSSDSDRQSTDLQRDALLAAGVDPRHLFEDRASGAKDDRAGLARALAFVRAGDVLVVWNLDQIGRGSFRDRVWRYVSISWVAVPLKKKQT